MPDDPVDAAGQRALEPALRALLRGNRATRELADGPLTPLSGGLSNRAWRLDAQGQAWFVRLGHRQAPDLGVDRASECAVLGAVCAAGLAPPLLVCDPCNGLLVTQFVAGRAWRAEDVRVERNLGRAAALMRSLHALPLPAAARTVSFARQARNLADALPAPASDEAVLRARAAQAFAVLEARRQRPALCHHDLHHLNLLDDGRRLWAVDWEYGGRGDPLMDVAGFLALHGLGPAPTETFLTAYAVLPASDRALLDTARWAFDYVQWLWYRCRFPASAGTGAETALRLAQRLLHCDNSANDFGEGEPWPGCG